MDILTDTYIWMVFSFLLVLFIMWRFAKEPVIALLDKRIAEIKKELETAENLRVEAQEMLAQYQRKQRDAEKEAKAIIENAEKSAEKFRVKAEKDLKETMARREKQLEARLERMQIEAVQEIQSHAATLAIKAAEDIIVEKLDNKTYDALVEKSTNSIEQESKTLN